MIIRATIFFCFLLTSAAFSQEAAFDDTKDLTPEEEKLAGDYIHQSKADRVSHEKCKDNPDGYDDLCTQSRFGFKNGTGQFLEAFFPTVTKAYSAIMAKKGGKFVGTAKKGENQGQSEEKEDFCAYIPMVGEATNIAYTQIKNNKTQQNYGASKPQAKQVASFKALAESHDTHRKASNMQVATYGASAGCYAAYLWASNFTPNAQSKKSMIIKMGASTVVATFYGMKAKAHANRRDAIRKMAEGLPQAGDCNPYTDTTCFCNEVSSFSFDPVNFKKFCIPEPFVARADNNDAFVCADSSGKADPTCKCSKNGTCIDKRLKAGALDFGIAPTVMKDPLAGLKPLSKGFGAGNVSANTRNNLAMAKKAMKNYKPNTKENLNAKQKDYAKGLVKLGIPKNVAAAMASQYKGGKSSSGNLLAGLGPAEAMAKDMGLDDKAIGSGIDTKYQTGSSGFKKKSSRKSNPFGRFKKNKNSNGSGIEIDEEYAKRATLAAEIISNSEASIFRVINNRYQKSGWKQFPDAFEVEKK